MVSTNVRAATTYPAIVGGILQQKRHALGLSQSAIARQLGITQGAWSRIENGSSVISLEQLHACAKLLKESPAAVIALADNAEQQLTLQGVEIESPKSDSTSTAIITGAALGVLLAAILLKK